MGSVSQQFEAACRQFAARVAMYEPSGAPVQFSGLFFTVMAFAEALQDRGVRPGNLVAVEVRDAIAATALRLAVLRLGATVVPSEVAADWRLVEQGVAAGDIVVGPEWIRPPSRLVPLTESGRMVKTTSGTTGTPKLRVFSEAALLARILWGMETRGAAAGAALIGYAPGSSPGFANMLRVLFSGQAVVQTEASPQATLAAMVRHGVTTAFLSPWNFQRLLEAAEAGVATPAGLVRIQVGGGAVSPAQALRGEAAFGAVVTNTYGSNETGSIAHHRPALSGDHPGCVGRIYPGIDWRFVEGELWVQVPGGLVPRQFPDGQALVDAEGWAATGDLGRMLADGTLVLTGRRAEVINIGGVKRAPSVFEAALTEVAGVREVVAFAAPQASGMDHVGLALRTGPEFDLAGFEALLAARFGAGFPVHLLFVDAVPVTEAGKVDRRQLAELLSENQTKAAE